MNSEPDILSKVLSFTQSHDQNIFCLNNCQSDGKLWEADLGRKNALHLARLCFYPSKGTEINNALTLWQLKIFQGKRGPFPQTSDSSPTPMAAPSQPKQLKHSLKDSGLRLPGDTTYFQLGLTHRTGRVGRGDRADHQCHSSPHLPQMSLLQERKQFLPCVTKYVAAFPTADKHTRLHRF